MSDRICSIDECNKPHLAKGYCSRHYQSFSLHKDPLFIEKNRIRPVGCSIDECPNPHRTNGYCSKHYERVLYHGDPNHGEIDPNRTEKECTICGKSKNISEFNPNSNMTDGTIGQCKGCINIKSIERRKSNPEHVRAVEREWARGNEEYRARRKEKTDKVKNEKWYKDRVKRYKASDIKRHPERHACRDETNMLIRTGVILESPCEVCGNIKSEAHHKDYTDPYGILWLCRKHHMELHNRLRDKARKEA